MKRPAGAMLCVALLMLTLGGAPLSAMAADGAAVNATNTLVGEVHLDNRNRFDDDDNDPDNDDDNYGTVINRLNLGANTDGIQAALRIDSTTFFDPPTNRYINDLRVERLSLTIHHHALTLKGGDFYRQLGRGIVLSIRKVDELGVDLAIRGGEVGWVGDDHEMSVFAGQINPANLDSVSQKYLRDSNDALAGGSYAFRAIDGLEVGLFGIYMQPRKSLLDGRDSTSSGGLSLSLPTVTESVALYLEGDFQHKILSRKAQRGWAGYGTADVQLGDTTLFLEGLYLDGFELRGSDNKSLGSRHTYNRPPTLQRLQEEVLNNRDVRGGRLKVEHFLEAWGLLVFANVLWRQVGVLFDVLQLHGWGGIELEIDSLRSTIVVSGGFRDVHDHDPDKLLKTISHGEVDWLQPLGAGLAMHLVSTTEYLQVPITEPSGKAYNKFVRGSSLLGIELSRWGSLTFELGYDTQNQSAGIRNLFYAGIASLEITDALRLTATGGTQRGGIKCIAGVCRDYPAFAGARLEVVGRY